ncbi:DUF3027 domain-containing protein [Actinacidiphila yeochonensis]|uniref:DUF3027 domain-containing protein n=1 Tax=Actinacidiphila yeochonensis TaxID=89050 RepID=UPI00055CDE54|nr:DUF3027 domain-containing protein [Actinacidiphila yeochonensis]
MRSRTPDRLCAEAVDLARTVTREAVGHESVGEHLGVVAEGDRVVTHLFACEEPAYRGWRWATTLTRASRGKAVTVDETVLLPGTDAVLAPAWVPWSERLRPGDMGPGDLLPTEPDDPRLEPGWTGGAEAQARARAAEQEWAEVRAAQPAEPAEAEPELEQEPSTGVVAVTPPPSTAEIGAVAREIGMDRARVLSRYGLKAAAERWEERFGPETAMAQAAPARCASCAFLVPVAGSLRQAFGVCANEYASSDGQLVSLEYGCGGHSEAAVMPRTPPPPPMVLDDLNETDQLHPETPADPAEGDDEAAGDPGTS